MALDPGPRLRDGAVSLVFDTEEFSRYIALLRSLGVEPTTIPAVPGTKGAAVKWAERGPGENGPHFPDTVSRLILTGSRSCGICIVDIDASKGGFENFAKYEAAHPPALPPLFTVRSPSGGLHLYYRPRRAWRTCTDQPCIGVDLRGEGGVAMVPGSVHPKGGIFRIEDHP